MQNARQSERGSAAVEFAIILPIFVLLIFSLIDFGRYFYVRVMITNSSIEVASTLTRGLFDTGQMSMQGTDGTIQDFLEKRSGVGIADFSQAESGKRLHLVVTQISPNNFSTDITNSPNNACPGSNYLIRVSVSTPFKPITSLNGFLINAIYPTDVSSVTTMRCIR